MSLWHVIIYWSKKMLSNKRVLVTGGCGFIGQILSNFLAENNDVIVVDKVSASLALNSSIQLVNKDLTNLEDVSSLFKHVDVVFHLAADISIRYCIENPNKSLYNNTVLNNNVLECCRVNNVKRMIFSSTAAVYKQKFVDKLYAETDELDPLNPYSASKAYGENLCRIYWNLYGIETVSLRYFNVYGNSKITSSYSSVLNNFLYNVRNNKKLSINGDGHQTRDFIHVDDVVRANILAASAQLETYGEVFNIGSGKAVTILDVANSISKNIEHAPQPAGELRFSQAKIQKANDTLKWSPQHNLFEWLKKESAVM